METCCANWQLKMVQRVFNAVEYGGGFNIRRPGSILRAIPRHNLKHLTSEPRILLLLLSGFKPQTKVVAGRCALVAIRRLFVVYKIFFTY